MKKIAQVRSIDELHGKEKAVVFGPFQVSAIHYVLVPQLAEGPHFTAKAGGEGLVAGPFAGEKLHGSQLAIHQGLFRQVDGAKASLAEFAHNAIGTPYQHAWFQVDDFAEHAIMCGARVNVIGETGCTLRAVFHLSDLTTSEG